MGAGVPPLPSSSAPKHLRSESSQAPLLRNGGFEIWKEGKPEGWTWSNMADALTISILAGKLRGLP